MTPLAWAGLAALLVVFAILLAGAFIDPDELQRRRALEDAEERKTARARQ